MERVLHELVLGFNSIEMVENNDVDSMVFIFHLKYVVFIPYKTRLKYLYFIKSMICCIHFIKYFLIFYT